MPKMPMVSRRSEAKDLITIQNSRNAAPRSWPARRLLQSCLAAYRRAGLLDSSRVYVLNLQFLAPGAMSALNQRYRGKKKPTDVLSFEIPGYQPPAPAPHVLGDLVICPQVLREQARDVGHSVADELTVLLVHGLAHLLGYDHEGGKKQEAAQRRVEAQVLADLGTKKKPLLRGLMERGRSTKKEIR
jgi:probable rRNA maturation factor